MTHWTNFHTHSHYCDGKGPLGDYIHSAHDSGIVSLGFSSHAPLPFPSKWCMKPENLGNYLSEIELLNRSHAGVELYKGLEIDFIPDLISPADFRAKLDYTIGSVHFTDRFADGRHWEIDGSHASFMEGLDAIFHGDMKGAVTRYFELTREMVSKSAPDIVGHMDKIKIQNAGDKFFSESDSWYVNEVKNTLDVIASAGSIVEVNTRGIYQKKSSTIYPSPWVLEIIHDRSIPITLSSDAHHCSDLINQFSETAVMLRKIGFKKLTILSAGKWGQFEFDEHGIKRE